MRTSYGKISKVKLDKTELNMKDLDEKFKRKSYTHLKSNIYIFLLDQLDLPQGYKLFIFKFYVEELLTLVSRVNLILPLC